MASQAVMGCKREEPKPTKVTEQNVLQPNRRPERKGPFKSPKDEPPDPRSGAQLDAASLEKALAEADEHLAKGDKLRAMRVLMPCANKVEQSVPCEARMAKAILGIENYRAHALYYLAEATKVDQKAAPTSLYRELGELAIQHARFEEAAAALGIVINRGEATARDYASMANAVVSDRARLEEAIEALGKAYALDGTQHEWLRDRAILVAQTGDGEKAIALFEEYLSKAPKDAPDRAAMETRVAELRLRAQAAAGEDKDGKGRKNDKDEGPSRGSPKAAPTEKDKDTSAKKGAPEKPTAG